MALSFQLLVSTSFCLYALFSLLHRYVKAKTTALFDLEHIAEPLDQPKMRGQAVICGGSWAGLCAARILSDHYDRVLILDDEHDATLIAGEYIRPHVYQWNELHSASPLAMHFNKRLFPGYLDHVRARDGRTLAIEDVSLWQFGRRLRFAANKAFDMVCMSRAGMEAVLRSFALELPNVELVKSSAVDVEFKDKRASAVLHRLAGTTEVSREEAAIVVDATGISKFGLRMRKKHGFEIPRTSTYTTGMETAAFNFSLTEKQWQSLSSPYSPGKASMIFLCATNQLNGKPGVGAARLEHHRILIDCNAIPSLYTLPTSLEELGAALKVAGVDSWIATDLFDALCKACPEPESHQYRQRPYYRVHYDEITSPDNMISLGDATVSLNPIYGQGLSQAAQQSCALDAALRRERRQNRRDVGRGFADRFFGVIMKRSDNLLRTNKLLDFAWPTAQPCEGEYLHKEHRSHHPLLFRFLHAVISAASADEVVSSALCGGIFGLATSFGLLAPNVLVRIAYDAYWRRRNEAKVRFLQ